ncbi:GeoRSP system PqqD family peptide chaperone [Geoalkalibacter sp.]|uniref:GeoRSP system PqqD family peptide chaperone n=1 Tax=Geoalkalibacter sp. TaxID=3041440 RepID=UPI00272DE7E7|nr:GeoRSP system PqqD family peptide chaperone [Geoalkalibacter sp.]
MKRPLRNPQIVWRHEKRREEEILKAQERGEAVEDRGTVILIISGMMHQLNLVGGHIWSLCDGSRDVDGLIEALAEDFEVEREELVEDVRDFLADLEQRGWLSYV